jgi:hypothetical protein
MWQAILRFFGLGKRPGTGPSGVPKFTPKKNLNPSQYYRRGGKFFSSVDDSLIEDLVLLDILMGYYEEGHIEDLGAYDVDAGFDPMRDNEPEVDILDMDVSDTPVAAATNWKIEVPAEEYVEPATYTPDPEPVKQESYSSGSSYASGSSDYDSGSSDSGGGSDD